METIIIRNNTDLSSEMVFSHVYSVIKQGRISNDGKAYCYLTRFDTGVAVAAKRNKSSDTFVLSFVAKHEENLARSQQEFDTCHNKTLQPTSERG